MIRLIYSFSVVFSLFLMGLGPVEAQQHLGSFDASIAGDVKAQVKGSGSAIRYQDGGVVLTLNEAQSGKTIVLTFPSGASVGEHALKSFGDAYKSGRKVVDYGASYSQVGSKTGAKVAGWLDVKDGTVTLDSLEPLRGRFRFSSENPSEGKIRVSGEFRDVSVTKMP